MKFLDVLWCNGVGIVKVETDFGEVKYYMGSCLDGNTEQQDVERIMNWGSRIHPEVIQRFMEMNNA